MAVVASALAPEPDSLASELRHVPDEIERLLRERRGIDAAVERLAAAEELIVSGRGLVYGTALELALKLEETCLRPVRGLSYADLRHGPIAVVDADIVAVLVSAGDGPMIEGMIELAKDLRARGATALGVGGDDGFARVCDGIVEGPQLSEALAPLALIVPGQLIVEALARRLGLDPDAPRGLSKVTQTDRQ
jgi:glucosamine--fructose-6-phosphate aminotransferase (isomerizing)